MKQRITSLLAIGTLALVLSTSTVFANDNLGTVTVRSTIKKAAIAKKLVISGNVEVTIVQDAESSKLYTNDGTTKARVYEDAGTIYVSAKKNAESSKVTVYVDNISRIKASGEAKVTTKNLLNVQYLQIVLKDKAAAKISAITESLYTKLMNESALKLQGKTGSFAVSTNELALLNTDNFKAKTTDVEKRNTADYARVN
jgi:hypothetical protein